MEASNTRLLGVFQHTATRVTAQFQPAKTAAVISAYHSLGGPGSDLTKVHNQRTERSQRIRKLKVTQDENA